MRHEADLVTGPLYGYLGHFSQRCFLCAGHNDLDASGKQNSADDQNSFVEQNASANAPGAVGAYTSTSALGNPL
jgi:hypothetical protein